MDTRKRGLLKRLSHSLANDLASVHKIKVRPLKSVMLLILGAPRERFIERDDTRFDRELPGVDGPTDKFVCARSHGRVGAETSADDAFEFWS